MQNALVFAAFPPLLVAADTAKINGSDLYYESIGNGPPLLIMHGGLGLSHNYLRPYFDQMAQSHTVIYYDHLGNGRSARPDNFDVLKRGD